MASAAEDDGLNQKIIRFRVIATTKPEGNLWVIQTQMRKWKKPMTIKVTSKYGNDVEALVDWSVEDPIRESPYNLEWNFEPKKLTLAVMRHIMNTKNLIYYLFPRDDFTARHWVWHMVSLLKSESYLVPSAEFDSLLQGMLYVYRPDGLSSPAPIVEGKFLSPSYIMPQPASPYYRTPGVLGICNSTVGLFFVDDQRNIIFRKTEDWTTLGRKGMYKTVHMGRIYFTGELNEDHEALLRRQLEDDTRREHRDIRMIDVS